MKYLLDTNTCIYFLNGNESLKKKFGKIGVYSLSISNCVLAELYFGAYRSKKVEENVKHIELFKKNLTVLSDSEESPCDLEKSRLTCGQKAKLLKILIY